MPDLLLPLLALGISMSLTPGPNNFMVAASGANFGWRRSLPLYFGIVAGFVSLLLAVGFGLGAVFERYPILHEVLRYAGAAYLIWLGIKIATGWSGRRTPDARSSNGSDAPPDAAPARASAVAPDSAAVAAASVASSIDAPPPRPFGFLQGAAFQWINPKAWVLAVGAMAAFTLVDRAIAPQILMIAGVLGLIALPSLALWLASGVLAARYLRTERAMRIFNITLGVLCIASVVFIFI